MKISILGYSGSGKSTLAKILGEKYDAEVLYLDKVHWLPGWKERPLEEKAGQVGRFLDEKKNWIIDGNYTKLCLDRRLSESDEIVLMKFNRFSCFFRACKRYRAFKGKTRESMTEGCDEKIDFEFARWILWSGRSKKHRKLFSDLEKKYPEKVFVIKNQRQLDSFKENLQ